MSESRTAGGSSTVYYGGTGAGTGQPADQAAGSGADQASQAADQAKQKATEVAGQAKEQATQVAGQAKEQASQAVDTAKQKAGQVAEQATTQVDAGMEKAAGGLDKAADMLRQKTESMPQGGGVQSIASTAATQLDKGAQYLKDKDTDQLVADLEAMVRQKPTQTLLVAAGIGFLLSKVVR